MHKALEITEIVVAIIEALPRWKHPIHTESDYIDWDEISLPPLPADALALALTCKTFLNPALDALWSVMYSMEPLLKCLVPHDWERFAYYALEAHQITPSNLARFAYYAPRIRLLHTEGSDAPQTIWRVLSVHGPRSSRPILPNLCTLCWHHTDVTTFIYIPLFASPSLRSLTLFYFSWEWSHSNFVFSSVSTLAAYSPALCHLILFGDNYHEEERPRVLLSAFPFLTSVSFLCDFTWGIADQLSRMPDLRCLRARAGSFGYSRIDVSSQITGFASLEELALVWADLDNFTLSLDVFSTRCNIRTISAEHVDRATAVSVENFVAAVCKLCSTESLTDFRLAPDEEVREDPFGVLGPSSIPKAGMPHLSPLFIFRRMESIYIACCDPDWDDGLLGDIASAWPNLRRLTLLRLSERPAKLTYAGLLPIPKGCPRLKYLEVTLAPWDSSFNPLQSYSRDGPTLSPPLHICIIHDEEPLPEAEAEARSYLKRVFPNSTSREICYPI